MDTLVLEGAHAEASAAAVKRFEILDTLGSGGTGCVWRARDRESGGIVALKSLHATCAANPIVVARFEREARLAARIRHANVALVHGTVEQDGIPYLCMEYVEGRTLGRILASGNRIPLTVALSIFRQACDGVQAAHEEGIIHRDLKPDNILVARRDGRAVILDFGIARTLACDDLTQAGLVVGSIHYMSPEQLCGGATTVRTDIYALGVILYELATGICPFRAPDLTLAQCVSLRANVPDPREHVGDLPDALVEAIATCLSPDPADRFATPAELWQFLATNCSSADAEAKGLTLYVEGREVVIGRPAEAVVAMLPGPERDEVVDRLRRIGYTVSVVHDAGDALQRSFDRRSQLLVMGEGLAGPDPITACQIMRRFARWDATRALILVDARDQARQSQAREAGAADVATLPLQIHAFARQARQLLQDGG
jgi:CheY-like chemotaxis protein